MWLSKVGRGARVSAKVLMRKATTFWVAVVILGFIAILLIPSWEITATSISPDAKTTASVVTSRGDGVGLAPYGDHVILTMGRKPRSQDLTEPTFAGYCANGAKIAWVADKKLRVTCGATLDGVKRQDSRWQDIEIVYAYPKH